MSKLIERIAVGFSSVIFLFLLIPLLARFLDKFKVLGWVVLGFIAAWTIALILFEIKAVENYKIANSLLLKNLRFAPAVVFLSAVAIIPVFDQLMILHSQWKVYSYIHITSSPEIDFEFDLHNDHRGFCGNGYSARRTNLYFKIASSELNNPNPAIRARSVQASIETYDWLNGMQDYSIKEILENACNDSDSAVRKITDGFIDKTSNSCVVEMGHF